MSAYLSRCKLRFGRMIKQATLWLSSVAIINIIPSERAEARPASNEMWILAGLGNPDASYVGTRHNAGRDFVMALAKKEDVGEFKMDKKLRAASLKGQLFGAPAMLLCPDTMMNNSGASIKPLIKSKAQATKLVVAHDDLDLPLGVIKLSFGSGPGGHKGVESIQKALKTRDFVRIRIGISPSTPSGKLKKPDAEKVIDFVLGKFRAPEQEKIKKVYKHAGDAVELLVTEGLSSAMNRSNTRV